MQYRESDDGHRCWTFQGPIIDRFRGTARLDVCIFDSTVGRVDLSTFFGFIGPSERKQFAKIRATSLTDEMSYHVLEGEICDYVGAEGPMVIEEGERIPIVIWLADLAWDTVRAGYDLCCFRSEPWKLEIEWWEE